MRSLEELKSVDDGGYYDRLVKEMEEVANGDESVKLKLLTKSVLKEFIDMRFQEATERKKLLALKEKESDCVNLDIRIPKKIRSKVPLPNLSRIESNNKSIVERCYLGVVEEEEGEIVKKSAVKKQSKTDSLKKRKADGCLEEEDERKKKKERTTIKKNNLDYHLSLSPPPDLSQEFKDRIERMNGTNVMLVIQKELTRTDMDSHEGRFSVPNRQVRSHEFLSDEERLNGISCALIQPCLEEITGLEFKKWDMTKTFIYSLKKKWNSVASNTRNQLEIGSTVQLWSFRVDMNLWFAMVKLK